MKKYLSPSSVARLVGMVLLLWALDKHPYGYYTLLRWLVCGVSAYSTLVAINLKKIPWAWILGITAVIFNPIIPIHLSRETWATIDITAAGILGASTFFVREQR
jgi:hypothetical protein